MPPPPPPSIQQQQQQQQQSLQSNLQKMTISAKQQDAQTKIIEQMIILKDPPVDLDYIVRHIITIF
jgi:hypothetical protein